MPVNLPSNWSRSYVILATIALALGLLFWLRPILIPFALAILLTFVAAPVVSALQDRGVPRLLAVILVSVVIFSMIAAVGWGVARQAAILVDTFPEYEHNLSTKIATLKAGDSGFFKKLERIVSRVGSQIEDPAASADEASAEKATAVPVKVVSDDGPFGLSGIWAVIAPILEPFAAVGLAAVLVIFMLIKREDLRDRIIALIGHGRLSVTTKALDEAGERISRFLLMQLVINATYGIAAGTGLYLIGVPHAWLWGFFAAIFRYIPYLGPWIAALLPIGLSVLVSDNWTMPVMVVALFLTLELISNMVMEPWLYGRNVGVSPTATLAMVAFWTWLWGPIGLILATPLTVCLVVVGKYVPSLQFFDTLLGDRPPLEAHIAYYQRLLARDQDEALDIAEEHLKSNSLEKTLDTLVLPALLYAERDFANGGIDESDQRFVLGATREIVEELAALQAKESAETPAAAATPAPKLTLLACPARDETDEVALHMLKELLDPSRYETRVISRTLLASEVVELVEEVQPALFIIAAPPPGGQSHTRLLLLRLRMRFPKLGIVVGRWGLTDDVDQKREQILQAGANEFGLTLEETRRQIEALLQLDIGQAENAETVLKEAAA